MTETEQPTHEAFTTLWMEQATRSRSPETLRSTTQADICVVGGGYTGLWTAIHVKERRPELDVCLVEAAVAGAGASGANGGFAMTWWPKFATLKKLFGSADAVYLGQLSEKVVQSIGTYLEKHQIEADFIPSGWLWAATNATQVGSWDNTISQLAAAHQTPYAALPTDEVQRLTGSAEHLGGVIEGGVATIHPGKFVQGLLRRALELGVRVYELSPMRRMERRGSFTEVVTTQGRVQATSVVLATNAALGGIPEIRRNLVIVGSDVVATAPCGDVLAGTSFPNGLAVSDSRRLVHYYRSTSDDRLVFGKGGGGLSFCGEIGGAATSGPNGRHDAVESHLRRLLPRLSDVPVTHRWSGKIDYSVDGLPFAGRLRSNPSVSYMTGFSGNGVGPAYLAGQVLASMALDSDDDWSRLPIIRRPKSSLPPEPFRFVGGNLVRVAMVRQERLQDQGQKVDAITRLITGLDPTSFVG
ncbi:NAD(P)/FAD-dependent oxidoreductase [Arthrobacter sp. NyZ413]|uniref:NAD(P)/FAD-dependent oxidoreductase n=1 Tax=Arthrobacter sp. NyZ413 TaxID=3144669 RepID=UPI003BF8197C